MKLILSAAVFCAALPAMAQMGVGRPMTHDYAAFTHPMRAAVTNAPYSATENTTATEKLQDGTALNRSSSKTITRDSLGRTREEITLPTHDGSAGVHTVISIFDPVARTITQLRPEQKIAVVRTLSPAEEMGHRGFHHEGMSKGPAQGAAAEAGNGSSHPHGPRDENNVVKTDLGSKTIAGVVATGTRVTRTVPVGAMGNATPIVSTHEEWFSPDLKVEVSRTDNDPFRGTRSVTLLSLSRAEPDAALFKVPSDYTVRQAPERSAAGPGFRPHREQAPSSASHDGNPAAPGM